MSYDITLTSQLLLPMSLHLLLFSDALRMWADPWHLHLESRTVGPTLYVMTLECLQHVFNLNSVGVLWGKLYLSLKWGFNKMET
ncbi:hypothetical protein AB205_0163600 [Aquarana catesbeiana]|uniref:Uncharacterized protein n=1 Tax=Aquarana catesbeiana TaxID=8400 RepID=A0A2G9Q1P0_AQUCT|nr:hypothetical protein AB205_0163600 [Aquarana catesbeiana]